MSRLIETIQRTLHPLWNVRVPGVISEADAHKGEDPCAVYVLAYRNAYFAAVEDLLVAGLISYPNALPMASGCDPLASEDVH